MPNYKKISKKSKSKLKPDYQKITVGVMVAALVVIATVVAIKLIAHEQRVKNDKASLALISTELSKINAQAFNNLKPAIKKDCYRSDQGPWDNGRLWCAVHYNYSLGKKATDDVPQLLESSRDAFEDNLKSSLIVTNPAKVWTYPDKALRDSNGEYELAQSFQARSGDNPIVCT